MSAEETKPAITTEAGVVEPTPAPAETLASDKPAEAVEPKAEEPAAATTTTTEGEAAAPAAEEKKEKAPEKPVEPITSGALGYKAPGLKHVFRSSKRYFWLGDEAVPTAKLNNYLRGEKPEVAHPTAAWSSQTGKGLLYFVKHEEEKETPAGVLNLSEATDLSKDGLVHFFFKLHGHKHTFEAQTAPERNGWFVALEKAIEEAKAESETVLASEGYKESLEKLGKPAPLAAAVSTPKKSIDATPKLGEAEASTEAAAAATAAPARTGSASSDSADDKKKAKSKSRSVSRGKRSSIFGSFLGKKDKAEEKKEEKKDEAEAKKEEEAVAPVAETAPVIPDTIPSAEEAPKPAEEAKAEETPAAEPAAEEAKPVEEKPKPSKRGSIFGNFAQKLKSPTHEKKEHEVVPAVPAKDTEAAAEAPKAEEAPAVPAAEATTEEAPKAEEVKPATTTPHKERSSFSFGKFLGSAKEKVKSPTTEKPQPEAPKTEEPAKAEEAPVAPVEAAAEAPKEEENKEEAPIGVTSTASAAPAPKKRGSIFGNLTGSVKKEKEGESEKPKGLTGLFRNASKAGKSKKEKESAAAAPAKVEETAEPKEAKAEEAPKAEEKKEEEEPVAAIGDVVPDAVQVGQAPKSTPEVSATA